MFSYIHHQRRVLPGITLFFILLTGFTFASEGVLTQADAQKRAQQISDVNYTIFFGLGPDTTTYQGRTEITFTLLKTDPVFLDYFGKKVEKVTLNGAELNDYNAQPEIARLEIPAKHFKIGAQKLTIEYVGEYGTNGVGFHRYVDPEDGLTYLFTDFEPYDAHRAFPCFDQPDLKATYQLSVKAPADWEVISNTPVLKRVRQQNEIVTEFKRSARFSTYLFHVSAGPYAHFSDPDFRYPLGLYCRQSLARYMDADYLFKRTREGFDFFEEYFDIPYPFQKYDQIFAPEFTSGAMENVGAIIWNESSLYRQKPTQGYLRSRDETLFHEMAHQWFGNLVTMSWWDDLWLNESFASYMGYMASEAVGNEGALAEAYMHSSARNADQKSTSHPVLATIPDTAAASSNFDSITYGKGFSTLIQLDYFLGGTVFRDGIRNYLKSNSWSNTRLAQFTQALEDSYGKPLQPWMDQWLGTTGLNRVEVRYETENGKITKATLHQHPGVGDKILRAHATDIGLYYLDQNGKASLGKTIKAVYHTETLELPEMVGLDAPAFVLPNYNKRDYLLVNLDNQSLVWLKENLASVANKEVRKSIWEILFQMMRDDLADPRDITTLAIQQLEVEEDPSVLSTISHRAIVGAFWFAPDDGSREEYGKAIFNLAHSKLNENPGSDSQPTWLTLCTSSARRANRLDFLHGLFNGSITVEDYTIRPSSRWSHLQTLITTGYPVDPAEIEALKNLDKSSSSTNWQIAIAYSKPDAETRALAWDRILSGKNDDGSTMSATERYYVALGHTAGSNYLDALMKPYIKRYFEALPELQETMDWVTLRTFIRMMYPTYGGDETIQLTRALLTRDNLKDNVRKLLTEELEDLQTYEKIRSNWGRNRVAQSIHQKKDLKSE